MRRKAILVNTFVYSRDNEFRCIVAEQPTMSGMVKVKVGLQANTVY